MSFDVVLTDNFEREAKRLRKKYRSLKTDISILISPLEENTFQGNALGKACYKICISIKSKGKGKSGRGRVISYVYVQDKLVYLLSNYDKSKQDSISDSEIMEIIKSIDQG